MSTKPGTVTLKVSVDGETDKGRRPRTTAAGVSSATTSNAASGGTTHRTANACSHVTATAAPAGGAGNRFTATLPVTPTANRYTPTTPAHDRRAAPPPTGCSMPPATVRAATDHATTNAQPPPRPPRRHRLRPRTVGRWRGPNRSADSRTGRPEPAPGDRHPRMLDPPPCRTPTG